MTLPKIFGALALLTTICAVPEQSSGQSRADLLKMNEFNIEFAPVYRNYISLADDIFSIEDLAVGVAEKKVMPSFASQQRLELYVKVKSKLNRFSNEVANLKVPIFRSMKFKNLANRSLSYLQNLHTNMEYLFKNSAKLLDNTLAGKRYDETKIARNSLVRMKLIMAGENEITDIALSMTKRSHPEFYHRRLIKEGNSAIIGMIDGFLNIYNGNFTQQKFSQHVEGLISKISISKKLVSNGRHSVYKARQRLASFSQKNAAKGNIIFSVLNSYETTFQNELAILSLLKEMLKNVQNIDSFETALESYNRASLKLNILIERRMELALGRQRNLGPLVR